MQIKIPHPVIAAAALLLLSLPLSAQEYGVSGFMPAFYPQMKEALTWPEAWGNSPEKDFGKWRARGRSIVLECMENIPPAPAAYGMEVTASEQREGYTARKIEFSLSAWYRVPAYLLVPDGEGPFPAVLVLHDHGAHFTIGKEKLVRPIGVAPEVEEDARQWVEKCYDGVFVGDFLAQHGYVVLAVDAPAGPGLQSAADGRLMGRNHHGG